ncbi:Lrp/AsnC family transcriptional regulator [Janibacter melonis]|uniref:Lrp/AsnC family transcriptional regulator n=1 Tax=Janibacter melonis TaxID=262209 RepID=UPI0019186093|nr:Lrp/AsnC ligand binding domain-containing protein [Janibacter melonis]
MVQAYVLIQTEVGVSTRVCTDIAKLTGVVEAHDVTGPYDVVARVEADTMADLGRLVLAQLQQVPGITRTLTCPIVHV